ncbi:cytochrome b/b6 domain-containing protein [Sphingomonas sp. NSE70-1]|uniref:Cytochrome b/b6 domain-containing protein n=1 Tax=Sphingomonas caseinilyticus TaxID=2908205 RepID=A0ABT0RYQ4_9SPHN|nr:cytochrome b/b6 domain-containing protein [Sphingomonas caseinilyticus]MCL6699825.1 cytochrome b/b6 domain-containing protein [Sphingomonas caseinilyticus]
MSDYMVQESSGPLAIRYRKIVMWIHWITALLLIMQVYIGFIFHDLPRGSEERAFVFGWHKTWGVLILLLALTRLAIRLINPPPPYPSDYPKWRRFFAVWNHRLFYILLLALPLTGLAAVSGRAEDGWVPLQLGLNVPAIPGIPTENDFGDVHEVLVWVTLALLALHVSAALFNQFVDRGAVAGRMWPFRQTRES